MVAFGIGLMLNYPRIEEQKERIGSHASNVLAVTCVIFAAGIFTGILQGTGMVDAMANSLLVVIPENFGPYLGGIHSARQPAIYILHVQRRILFWDPACTRKDRRELRLHRS